MVLSEKDLTLNESVKEVADSKTVAGTVVENGFNLIPVREPHRSSRGINSELMEKVAGQLTRVRCEDLFQLPDAGERSSVAQRSGGIDWLREDVTEIVTCPIDSGDELPRRVLAATSCFIPVRLQFCLADASVLGSPFAKDVKVLQRQPNRIEPRVAGRAAFVSRVSGKQLANRLRASNVRFDGRHARRWGRGEDRRAAAP